MSVNRFRAYNLDESGVSHALSYIEVWVSPDNSTYNAVGNISGWSSSGACFSLSNIGTTKNFRIQHPLYTDKDLVHSSLEGPETAVFYRGEGRLENGFAIVQLPSYFEKLARKEGRTIILTNIDGADKLAVKTQDGEQVKDGRFVVYSNNPASRQKFSWEVKAVRADVPALEVEPVRMAG